MTLRARVLDLAARTPPGRRTLIGVAGAPGAGKTTLAKALVTDLSAAGVAAAHVPMDGFHLADVALDRLGRRDRKGAPDTFDAAGYAVLLGRIAAGEAVWAPAFERDLEQPIAASIEVTTEVTVVVSEGNYLLLDRPEWRAARRWFAETWYARVDETLRLQRLIARHVEFGKTPDEARAWVLRTDEANARLVEASAPLADLQVDVAG
ncbi:nucleoside/nucleotide kinase family protein [Jatrophihabitans endophyticus]|uniref:nucleoside/nucleotide kinase family protein n=1 Tax=Jatrophihabitans endophyticus TaxID=1206085 RepID=UPI001A0EA1C6|nr:nucleoside/nucleotide kinase family protein [Jatrophihabitans endophyticus]